MKLQYKPRSDNIRQDKMRQDMAIQNKTDKIRQYKIRQEKTITNKTNSETSKTI